MSYHGRFESQKTQKSKKKKSAGKIVLIVVAVVLALVVGAIIAGVVYYNSKLDKINQIEVPKIEYTTAAEDDLFADPEGVPTEAAAQAEATVSAEPTETTEPAHIPSSEDYINILVVGQAARAGETANSERMADTSILCTINTHEKSLTLTSFLRDTLVRPPNFRGKEFGKIKLTTVYHLGSYYSNGDIAGSMELMNLTLFNNFGVEVDHNFEIDFDIFIKVIDLMNGVTVNLTQEESDYLNAEDAWVCYDTQPGWFHLDGAGALTYARMRKAEGDGDSDIKRTARQRHLIECIIFGLKQLSISDINKIADEVLPMITTSMSSAEITDMIMKMLPMLTELQIKTGGTCPVQGTYWGSTKDIYGDGFYHSVLEFEAPQQKKLMRAITEGESAD